MDNMNIITLNTTDQKGGAARIANTLHKELLRKGFNSNYFVGKRFGDDPKVLEVPNDQNRNIFTSSLFSMSKQARIQGIRIVPRVLEKIGRLGEPKRVILNALGYEDIGFPGTQKVISMVPGFIPDLIHLHNLHGDYFDLSYLQTLSKKYPVIITLHDMWIMTGHCAHAFECDRWKIGCGYCPDLKRYPAIKFDKTAQNYSRKKDIFQRSNIYMVGVSEWIHNLTLKSLMSESIIKSRVINNGIDTNIFFPDDSIKIRNELSLPLGRNILLYVGGSSGGNPYKDFETIWKSFEIVLETDDNFLLICLGMTKPKVGKQNLSNIHFVNYVEGIQNVAKYYQACDIYIHAANADTFPNSILEAMACGKPVIATDVGGVREQVKSGKNGYLVPQGDSKDMANKIIGLFDSPERLLEFGRVGRKYVEAKFTINHMMNNYLKFYEEVIDDFKRN